jgi:anti-sigma B factor antagonist
LAYASRVGVEVETEQRDGGVRVALSGDLDMATAPEVEERLVALDGPESPSDLVLDLRGLSFIDSTGLSLLINTDSRVRKAGRHVTIVSGRGAPRRLLETTGLIRRLDVVEEWEEPDCVQST